MFAFASVAGIRLLIEDEAFASFLDRSPFTLLVGTDALTDDRALEYLMESERRHPNLVARAFLNSTKTARFHPKMTWLKGKDHGSVVVGSGNLTAAGLRGNWEAYSIESLGQREMSEVEAYWTDWYSHNARHIRPVSDPDVLLRGRKNRSDRKAIRAVTEARSLFEDQTSSSIEAEEEVVPEDLRPWMFRDSTPLLIREVPRSGNRWKQVNFDISSYRSFMGAIPGDNRQRLLLRSIDHDGSVGEIEVRQTVSVASRNFRVELGAASGIDYPESGRPLLVMLRTAVRTFAYEMVMPSRRVHSSLNELLGRLYEGPGDRMRTVTTTAGVARVASPALGLFQSVLCQSD